MTRSTIAEIAGWQTTVAEYVRELAARHGVSYEPGPLDEFAEAATILSDNELPEPDETLDLLVALGRQSVISPEEGMALATRHIRERR